MKTLTNDLKKRDPGESVDRVSNDLMRERRWPLPLPGFGSGGADEISHAEKGVKVILDAPKIFADF